MGPENGRNNNEVSFFHLQDYISKIKLTDNTLFHLEETNRNFDDYFKKLSEVDKNAILYYWIDSLKKEIKYSNAIENNSNARYLAFDDDVFFETLNISHTRIKKLHQYITNSNVDSDYRKCDVELVLYMKMEQRMFFGTVQKVKMLKSLWMILYKFINKILYLVFSHRHS